jgi:HEAT repeat protein
MNRRSARGKKGKEVLAAEELLYNLAARGDADGRLNAIAVLGETGDPEAFDYLAAKLRAGHLSTPIHNAMITSLTNIDARRAIPILIKKLGDDDLSVRGAAAKLLGQVGQPILESILSVLAKPAYKDGALLALETLPVPQQQEPILEFIRTEIHHAREYDGLMRSVRAAQRTPAGKETGEDANELLAEALKNKSFEFGSRAVRALGLLTDRANMSLAVDQMHSTDPGRRAAALEMIDSIDTSRGNLLRPLINVWEDQGTVGGPVNWERLLGDSDAWVRACAVYAARRTDDRRLQRKVNALVESDTDPIIRAAGGVKGKRMKTDPALSLMDRILFLKRVPMFAQLSPGDLKQVAVIAEEAGFKDGEALAEEGELGDELFVLVEGEVIVTTSDASGQVIELARRGPGEYVGEMSIVNREPRMASLIASGNTYALTIDRKSFESLLRERPDVSLAVIRELSTRLKKNTDLLEQIAGQKKQAH